MQILLQWKRWAGSANLGRRKFLTSLFFDQVYDSREPSFTGKAVHSRKKLLKTCKAFFSFDLYQRVFVPLPRFMPAPRNQGSICADVFVL